MKAARDKKHHSNPDIGYFLKITQKRTREILSRQAGCCIADSQ